MTEYLNGYRIATTDWKHIDDKGLAVRAPVFGGWLVKFYDDRQRSNIGTVLGGVCFVPDPEHKWNVSLPPAP